MQGGCLLDRRNVSQIQDEGVMGVDVIQGYRILLQNEGFGDVVGESQQYLQMKLQGRGGSGK